MDLAPAAIVENLRLHPRVAQQGLVAGPEERARLAAALPTVVPFRSRPPQKIVALLDWDHRLPSRRLALRLHLFYDARALDRFEAALVDRLGEIKREDLFPEFNVPDLAELPSDEAYEGDVTLELAVESLRLVSPWRRELESGIAEAAALTVRQSKEFVDVRASEPARPSHLGELEAVAWTPPCESGHPRWTIDVWWLTAFDGRTGRGWSFLVEQRGRDQGEVVAHREFTVRTG